mmetsp:Transcript_91/g.247  ORF Transcript_91/g.247 Transcript_91/m.247 type:complete len:446 (+) Transcript_91:734-2071(+)
MPHERGHVGLLLQIHLHDLRQPPEELHVAPHHAPALELGALVDVPPDAHRQLHGDPVLAEVPPHLRLLLVDQAVALPKACHGVRDAADEGGEGHERQDDHADVEGALGRVGGHDLHGCGRELRQRPVQGSAVAVAQSSVLIEAQMGPALVHVRPCPNPIPSAGDEVVHDDDQHNVLKDLQNRQDVLRADVVNHLGEQVVQLQYSDQSQEAHEPENPPDPEVKHLLFGLPVSQPLEEHHNPVVQEQAQVHEEPSSQVALRRLREPRLQHAVHKVAHEEGVDEVRAPVGNVQVQHDHHQPVKLNVEREGEGHLDEIVEDAQSSDGLPEEPAPSHRAGAVHLQVLQRGHSLPALEDLVEAPLALAPRWRANFQVLPEGQQVHHEVGPQRARVVQVPRAGAAAAVLGVAAAASNMKEDCRRKLLRGVDCQLLARIGRGPQRHLCRLREG